MSSAPGKVILFGEHAVVYGKPAIAVPFEGVSTQVKIRASGRSHITTPYTLKMHEKERLVSLIELYSKELGIDDYLEIDIRSTIPPASGMGSSAALCVSLAKAMMLHAGKRLEHNALFDLALKGERLFHGNPSGLDIAVVLGGQPVYFIKGDSPQYFPIRKPIGIVVAHSGVQGDTGKAVSHVRKLHDESPAKYGRIFSAIAKISEDARHALESGDVKAIGALMDMNHGLLGKLGISNQRLDDMAEHARKEGAYGAKVTGAGMGGCIVAVAKEKDVKRIEGAFMEKGFEAYSAVLRYG